MGMVPLATLLGVPLLLLGAAGLLGALVGRAGFWRRAGLAVASAWVCLAGATLATGGDPATDTAPTMVLMLGVLAVAATAITGSLGEPIGPNDE